MQHSRYLDYTYKIIMSKPHPFMGLLQIDEVQGKCKTKIRSVYRIHENLSEHLTPQSAICNSPFINYEQQKYTAIVPAAGIGARMDSKLPKQYIKILGKEIIQWSIENLLQCPAIKQIMVVINPADKIWSAMPVAQDTRIITVMGGENRASSVYNSLQYLSDKMSPNDFVLVHDAVRPCITAADISNLIAQVIIHRSLGGVLGAPIVDTVKQVKNNQIISTFNRQNLWRVYTPQMFPLGLLLTALSSAQVRAQITDEAGAIEKLGLSPLMVAGNNNNIKLTCSNDLVNIKNILNRR